MKKVLFPIILFFVIILVTVSSNGNEAITKYQCENGKFSDSLESCEKCPVCDGCETCPQCEKCDSKALVHVNMMSIKGETYEDIFKVNIYNYGDAEAKNVLVRCNHYKYLAEDYEFTNTTKIEKIDPRSYVTKEIRIDIDESIDLQYDAPTYRCEFVSCDNCENLKAKEKISQVIFTWFEGSENSEYDASKEMSASFARLYPLDWNERSGKLT